MSDHIKRGMELHTNRDTSTEWRGIDDGRLNSVWVCQECGGDLKAKQRRGNDAYVSLECECAAASVDLRIADTLQFEVETVDTETIEYRREEA
jgi:hypothetical protein